MALKLKHRTQFPAVVSAATPLTITKTGLSYAFSVNVATLTTSVAGILTGTSGHFVPYLDGANTWSANQLLSAGSLGYTTGSGGAVTQITSRTTGVTLSKSCGAITLFTAAGSATAASFTVTNTVVAATDCVVVSVKSSTTNKYNAFVSAVGAGSFEITFNTTGGTTSDAPVFNFVVVKGVAA